MTREKIPIVNPNDSTVRDYALRGASAVMKAIGKTLVRKGKVYALQDGDIKLLEMATTVIEYYSGSSGTRSKPNLTASILWCMRYA